MKIALIIIFSLYLVTVFAETKNYDSCVVKVKDEIKEVMERAKNNELLLKNIAVIQNIDFDYEMLAETSSAKITVKFKDQALADKNIGIISNFLLKRFSLNYPKQKSFFVGLDESCKYHVDNKYLQFCEGSNIPDLFEEANIVDLASFSGLVYLSESVKNMSFCKMSLDKNILGNESLINPKDLKFFDKENNSYDFLINATEGKSEIDLNSAPYPLYLKYKNLTLLAKKEKCQNDTYSLEPRVIAIKSSDDKNSHCHFRAIVEGRVVDIDSLDIVLKKKAIEPYNEFTTFDDETNSCSSPLGRITYCEYEYQVNGKDQKTECVNSENAKNIKVSPIEEETACSFKIENLDEDFHQISYATDENSEWNKEQKKYLLKNGKASSKITATVTDHLLDKIESVDCNINEDNTISLKVKKFQDTTKRSCVFKVMRGKEELKGKDVVSFKFDEKNMECEKAYCSSDILSKVVYSKVVATVKYDKKEETLKSEECSFKALKIKGENEGKKSKKETSEAFEPDPLPKIEMPALIPVPSTPILIEY